MGNVERRGVAARRGGADGPGLAVSLQSPARFVFGYGASASLADEVRALGCETPLVVTKQSMVDRGDVAPALRSLEEGGVPFVLYGGVLPDAPIGLVDDAVQLLQGIGLRHGHRARRRQRHGHRQVRGRRRHQRRAGARHARPRSRAAPWPADDRRVHDARRRRRHRLRGRPADRRADARARRRRQPAISSPTSSSTTPMLTLTMTPEATVDTCVDTLVTGIECLTGRQANPLADLYSESILRICAAYLPAVVADGKDREARYNLALAASMGGWAYIEPRSSAPCTASPTASPPSASSPTAARWPPSCRPSCATTFRPAQAAFRRIAEIFGRSDGRACGRAPPARSPSRRSRTCSTALDVAHRLRDYGLRRDQIPEVAEPLVGSDRRLPRVQRASLRQAGRRDDPRRCVLTVGPSPTVAQWPYQDSARSATGPVGA